KRLNAGFRHGRSVSAASAAAEGRASARRRRSVRPSVSSATAISILLADQAHQQRLDARALGRERAHVEPFGDERTEQLRARCTVAAERDQDLRLVEPDAFYTGTPVEPACRGV